MQCCCRVTPTQTAHPSPALCGPLERLVPPISPVRVANHGPLPPGRQIHRPSRLGLGPHGSPSLPLAGLPMFA